MKVIVQGGGLRGELREMIVDGEKKGIGERGEGRSGSNRKKDKQGDNTVRPNVPRVEGVRGTTVARTLPQDRDRLLYPDSLWWILAMRGRGICGV